MPCIDRTSEFSQIADRLAGSIPAKPFAAGQQPPPRGKTTFALHSAEIRKYLNATTSKLERLAKLAGSKSVFDDPTQEIEELSFVVKGDIKTLQTRVAELKGTIDAKKQGQMAAHSQAVVNAMQSQLMQATTGFKDVLQDRASNMKSQQDRRGQFGGGATPFAQALALPGGQGNGSLFATPQQESSNLTQRRPLLGGGNFMDLDVSSSAPADDGDDVVINLPSMEQMQMVPQNSYGESRAVAVESIQKTMTELAEVYQQLNGMILDQARMVETIDNHVDDTVDNVEAAQDMWLKYLEGISSNRMLAVKIMSILLFFGLFFIVFLK